jgi:hypothetical protein
VALWQGWVKGEQQMFLCALHEYDLDDPKRCKLIDKCSACEAALEFYRQFEYDNIHPIPLPMTIYVRWDDVDIEQACVSCGGRSEQVKVLVEQKVVASCRTDKKVKEKLFAIVGAAQPQSWADYCYRLKEGGFGEPSASDLSSKDSIDKAIAEWQAVREYILGLQ